MFALKSTFTVNKHTISDYEKAFFAVKGGIVLILSKFQ